MSHDSYLEPTALIYGPDAAEAIAAGTAGRLVGGSIGFTQLKLITRANGGRRTQTHRYAEIRSSCDGALASKLDLLEAARPDLPGLVLPPVAVMGVVNVTPDSFSDGGQFETTETAVAQGRALAEAGASLLDIGGESTRPGSDAIDEASELERVLPVIEGLHSLDIPISIDTRKSGVMRQAAAAGAAVLNDISALTYDPKAMETARDLARPVVLMHSLGDPKTMQKDPRYGDVALDVFDALRSRIDACEAAGIPRDMIVADPGIGFGKTFAHNHALLRSLGLFHGLGVRIMLGVSRKAFIGALSGERAAGKRVTGSVTAALVGVMQGAHILRVHDVQETIQAVRTWSGLWSLEEDADT